MKSSVFSLSLDQPEYQVLKVGLENGLLKTDSIKLMNNFTIFFYNTILKKNNTEIDQAAMALAECNEEKEIKHIKQILHVSFMIAQTKFQIQKIWTNNIRNLMIKTNSCQSYYTRGRSAYCDCIYLTQNYTKLPLYSIRSYSNFMVLFKSSPLVAA